MTELQTQRSEDSYFQKALKQRRLLPPHSRQATGIQGHGRWEQAALRRLWEKDVRW